MKQVLMTTLLAVSTSVMAQLASSPLAPQPPNPFLNNVSAGVPAPQRQASAPLPLPDPKADELRAQFSNPEMPADVRTVFEGLVLIGRTDTHGLIGIPVQQQVGQSMSGQNLRTVSVKSGGDFYVGGRRVLVLLEPGGTGADLQEARPGGRTIWRLDVDSQRVYYPQNVQQNAGPVAAGSGVAVSGVQAANMGSSTASPGLGATSGTGNGMGNGTGFGMQSMGMQR